MDNPEELIAEVYNAMAEVCKYAYERKHDSNTDAEDQMWYQGKVDALRPILAMIQHAGYPKLEITLTVVDKVPDPIIEMVESGTLKV